MTKNVTVLVVVVLVFLLGLVVYLNSGPQNSEPSSAPANQETVVGNKDESSDQSSDKNTSAKNDIPEESSTPVSTGSTPEVSTDTTVGTDSDLLNENDGESITNDPEGPNEVVIDMIGINYEYDVKEIKVKKGDIVTINLTSGEGFHDWVVDEFGAATERINEGGFTSVTFVADKVGTFQYYCSVGKHRQLGMVGYLTVEDQPPT